MADVFGFIFTLLVLGYFARLAIEALASLWFYGLLAIGFLSVVVVLAHH